MELVESTHAKLIGPRWEPDIFGIVFDIDLSEMGV